MVPSQLNKQYRGLLIQGWHYSQGTYYLALVMGCYGPLFCYSRSLVIRIQKKYMESWHTMIHWSASAPWSPRSASPPRPVKGRMRVFHFPADTPAEDEIWMDSLLLGVARCCIRIRYIPTVAVWHSTRISFFDNMKCSLSIVVNVVKFQGESFWCRHSPISRSGGQMPNLISA